MTPAQVTRVAGTWQQCYGGIGEWVWEYPTYGLAVYFRGPDGRTMHVEMAWRDSMFMFGPEGGQNKCQAPVTSGVRPAVSLYVYCDDVDALFKRATTAGAKAETPPQDMFWGDRACTLIDPDGHIWYFATNVADFDPSKLPGPGKS